MAGFSVREHFRFPPEEVWGLPDRLPQCQGVDDRSRRLDPGWERTPGGREHGCGSVPAARNAAHRSPRLSPAGGLH